MAAIQVAPEVVFLLSPIQSTELSAEIVPIPPPADILVTELSDPIRLASHKLSAEMYLSDVEFKRRRVSNIPPEDVRAAWNFKVGSQVASMMNQIASAVAPMNFNLVLNRLDSISSNVTSIQADITAIKADVTSLKADVTAIKADVTSLKADVTSLKADVTSLKADVTAIKVDITLLRTDVLTRSYNSTAIRDDDSIRPPLNGVTPLPFDFPTTIGELKSLIIGDQLRAIEDYYQLGHQGNLKTRLKRVRRAYGVTGLSTD
jgi:outer membrane murein-binding lipoprotein Lpp